MTQAEALTIVQRYVERKVENEGIDEWGLLSAQDFNAIARLVVSLTTLEGLTNVNTGASVNDVVLFRAANSTTWTARPLSQMTVTVDGTPTKNSDNPVSSNGVYVRLSELLEQIEDLDASLENVAFIGDDDGSAPASSDPLNIYAQKTWVDLNYLPKRNMDSTPTDNSTNPVTSGGVKRYVDAKNTGYQKPASGIPMSDLSQEVQIKINSGGGGSGGGGATVTTFYVTSTTVEGTTTYDFGDTKFSDITAAIESSDIVLLNTDFFTLRHTVTIDDGGAVYMFSGIIRFLNLVLVTVSLTEGDNDSILVSNETYVPQNPDWSENNPDNASFIKNKPTLATVATSGSYDDLTDTPISVITEDELDTTTTLGIYKVTGTAGSLLQNSKPYLMLVNEYNVTKTQPTVTTTHYICQTRFQGSLITQRTKADGGTWSEWADAFEDIKALKNDVRVIPIDSSSYGDLDAIDNIMEDEIPLTGLFYVTVQNEDNIEYILVNQHWNEDVGVRQVAYTKDGIKKRFWDNETNVWGEWEWVRDDTKADKVSNGTANNAVSLDANGNIKDSGIPVAGIPIGKVDSTSTATAFTATVPGITELRDGVCVLLQNGVVTSAAGYTININGLGAKPTFNNMTAATRDTTIFNVNYTMLLIYDADRVVDGITGAWCCYRGYDGNTNTIGYQLRTNSSTLPVSDQTGRYRLLFTSADGTKYVPANTSNSTNATSSRAVNQRPIDPHGAIIYYGYTTVLAANANVGTAYQWQQYPLTLGYSFNRTNAALTLTYPSPIYIKCTPQSDGSAIIDADTPYVQSLPTTEDGKIYIYLGRAYSATAVELVTNHPVYEYKNGAIRQWVNAATQSGGSGGSGGDENVIESISFNGANVPVDANKNAAITANIPTELSELSEDSTHRVVTDTEKSNWNGKQDAISDLEEIRSNATAGAAKVSNVQSDWNATSGAAVILNKPTIPAAVTESTVSGWGFTKNAGTYSKPSDGIPSTDLATAVQNALTAAGTALQPADLNTLNGKVAALESLVSESANPTAAIDKFNEIVAFLANITNTDTLEGILSGINEAISAKYTKPSGGIPKDDLASTVQTSLGKADTALQSYTETDPTVPAWAKAATKPTYTPEEIGALPDTYTPPVLSVNGQTGAVNLIIPAAVTESTVSGWGFTKNTGTYSKPSGGIPKSDLADGVLPTNVSELTNDAGYVTDDSVVTIYSGNTTPSSSLGNNGDIYIQTS